MELSGPTGRLYGPVGQSRTWLLVGRFGPWAADLQRHIFEFKRLGPRQARVAEPATFGGEAMGFRLHPFYAPAWDRGECEVELQEVGTAWRFRAHVTIEGDGIKFRSTGPPVCQAIKGG